MRAALAFVTCAMTFAAGNGLAAGLELARVDGLKLEQIAARGFSLDREQTVEVSGVKLRRLGNRELMSVWILDAATRKLLWQLGAAREFRQRTETAHFRDSVDLPAGEYELYAATFPVEPVATGFFDWLWSLLSMQARDPARHADKVVIALHGEGQPGGEVTAEAVRRRLAKDALVDFTCVGDNARLTRGLAVSERLELELDAQGEVTHSAVYDGARILDVATHRVVWSLTFDGSEPAGGADKNRRTHTTLTFDPGRYLVQFRSDDSHSCPEYNGAPPFDPFAWGVVVRPVDRSRRASVLTFDYQDPLEHAVIANLTRLGDDEHRSVGFTLTRPLEVQVHAVGEGRGNVMYDYGWIVDASSQETVWSMTYETSEPAGGAAKNRLVDQVVNFQPGSYVVHFVTDGSHSFGDWNEAPPSEPERWGVILAAVNGLPKEGTVVPYDPDRDPAVLARVERVGNNAHERKRFELTRPTKVLVVALGEGSGGEMVDRGWITEAGSGRTVWEMEYDTSEHAGGAAKNRFCCERLTLPAGEYELRYDSDDSHAFDRWNDAPPFDPEAWGITVRVAPAVTVVEDPHPRR